MEIETNLDRQLLPPPHQPSRATPASNGTILRKYPDGIELIDGSTVVDGMLSMFATVALPAVMFLLLSVEYESLFDYLFIAFMLLGGVIPSVLFFRTDFVGYRYEPILFDRATRQVHVFTSQKVWWKLWSWGRQPFKVDSYPWDCIRGEVVKVVSASGMGTARLMYALVFNVTEEPGSDVVVARFGTGVPSVYDGGGEQVALWEHVRRFMQDNGPHLSEGDSLYQESGHDLWPSLWWWQPLLGPGSREFWITPMWLLTIPFGLLMMFLLPFTFIGGVVRWLAWQCKAKPRWPARVLDAVGADAAAHRSTKSSGRPGRKVRIEPRL